MNYADGALKILKLYLSEYAHKKSFVFNCIREIQIFHLLAKKSSIRPTFWLFYFKNLQFFNVWFQITSKSSSHSKLKTFPDTLFLKPLSSPILAIEFFASGVWARPGARLVCQKFFPPPPSPTLMLIDDDRQVAVELATTGIEHGGRRTVIDYYCPAVLTCAKWVASQISRRLQVSDSIQRGQVLPASSRGRWSAVKFSDDGENYTLRRALMVFPRTSKVWG